jgi:hypothetical protein
MNFLLLQPYVTRQTAEFGIKRGTDGPLLKMYDFPSGIKEDEDSHLHTHRRENLKSYLGIKDIALLVYWCQKTVIFILAAVRTRNLNCWC